MGNFFSRKPFSSNMTLIKDKDLAKVPNETKSFKLPIETLKKNFFVRKGTLVNFLSVPRDIFAPPPLDIKLHVTRYHSQNPIFGYLYKICYQDRCHLRKHTSSWLCHCTPLLLCTKAPHNHIKHINLNNNFSLRFMTPYLVFNTRYTQATSSEFGTLFGSIMKTTKLYPMTFYKGFLPSLLRSSPNAMLTLMLYEQMRSHLIDRK